MQFSGSPSGMTSFSTGKRDILLGRIRLGLVMSFYGLGKTIPQVVQYNTTRANNAIEGAPKRLWPSGRIKRHFYAEIEVFFAAVHRCGRRSLV